MARFNRSRLSRSRTYHFSQENCFKSQSGTIFSLEDTKSLASQALKANFLAPPIQLPFAPQVTIRNLPHSQYFVINGTHVKKDAPLEHLDIIQFGKYTFRFENPHVAVAVQLAHGARPLSSAGSNSSIGATLTSNAPEPSAAPAFSTEEPEPPVVAAAVPVEPVESIEAPVSEEIIPIPSTTTIETEVESEPALPIAVPSEPEEVPTPHQDAPIIEETVEAAKMEVDEKEGQDVELIVSVPSEPTEQPLAAIPPPSDEFTPNIVAEVELDDESDVEVADSSQADAFVSSQSNGALNSTPPAPVDLNASSATMEGIEPINQSVMNASLQTFENGDDDEMVFSQRPLMKPDGAEVTSVHVSFVEQSVAESDEHAEAGAGEEDATNGTTEQNGALDISVQSAALASDALDQSIDASTDYAIVESGLETVDSHAEESEVASSVASSTLAEDAQPSSVDVDQETPIVKSPPKKVSTWKFYNLENTSRSSRNSRTTALTSTKSITSPTPSSSATAKAEKVKSPPRRKRSAKLSTAAAASAAAAAADEALHDRLYTDANGISVDLDDQGRPRKEPQNPAANDFTPFDSALDEILSSPANTPSKKRKAPSTTEEASALSETIATKKVTPLTSDPASSAADLPLQEAYNVIKDSYAPPLESSAAPGDQIRHIVTQLLTHHSPLTHHQIMLLTRLHPPYASKIKEIFQASWKLKFEQELGKEEIKTFFGHEQNRLWLLEPTTANDLPQ